MILLYIMKLNRIECKRIVWNGMGWHGMEWGEDGCGTTITTIINSHPHQLPPPSTPTIIIYDHNTIQYNVI